MDKLELLEDALWKHGIRIDEADLGHGLEGYVRVYDDGEVYLSVNPCLPRLQKTAVAYHEAGHLATGFTGLPSKDELRANRWAFRHLISLDSLIEGLKKLPTSVFDLAEDMKVDPRFLYRYLQVQAATKKYLEYGDYMIVFCPIILHNWKTGQTWP